jgi:hypothetical protein
MADKQFLALTFAGWLTLSSPLLAEQVQVGGDTFASDSTITLTQTGAADAFASGFNVDINTRVTKDAHAAGFDVDLNAPIGGDAYAAGFSVEVTEPVGDDLTASAFNIHLGDRAAVTGNARLAGGSIVIDAPVAGSLTAAAGELTLNSVVTGDAVLTVGSMTFGPNARINGKLTYYARDPITIPPSVISSDRIQFERLQAANVAESVRDTSERTMQRMWPAFFSGLAAFALGFAFLVAVGAVLLAFAPERMEHLKKEALHSPVKMIVLGILGLSALIGLVPVSAMTLIGIPLVPVAILLAIAFWIVGYLAGAYALGMRLAAGFREAPLTMGAKVLALAIAVFVLAILNFIPFIGWFINLAVLFLGLGAMVMRLARHVTHEEPHVTEVVTINPVITPATVPEPPSPPQPRPRRTKA